MKKKDIFFACLFIVSFLVSALVMAGDYFYKNLGKDWSSYQESSLQESVGNNQHQIEQESILVQEAEKPKYQTVERDYFDDALFVGDSRTVGLMEYGNLDNASFFADSGMSVYGLALKKITIPGKGKVTFDEVLAENQYAKIYLMLGMNELGYHFETTKERFEQTVEKICEAQPDAVIYLDVNELFDDEEGYLNEEYTSDAFHVLGKYYEDWVDWLCTKAIIQEVVDIKPEE